MSTTVTYKGSTLTTAENQTRTLKTAGKYMEDDITIVDITENNTGDIYQDENGYLVLAEGEAEGEAENDTPSTKWTRPSNWPDLSKMDISNGDIIYMTSYADEARGFCSFFVSCTGSYTVEIGTISGTTFTAEKTETQTGNYYINLYYGSINGTYKVLRVTGDTITKLQFRSNSTITINDFNGYANNQGIIDIVGKIPSCTALTFQNQYNLINVELGALSLSGSINSMFYNCYSLTSLDVSNWSTANVTNMGSMFSYCASLISLDVSNWSTANVTSMGSMFYCCQSLTSLDVSNWSTAKVTSMSSMFYNCQSLTFLDVSNWSTVNVTDMSSMFYYCASLTSLDVSNWSTAKVTSMSSMFYCCNSLTSLDISNWSTTSVTNMSSMFNSCDSLTSLDVSDWSTTNVTNMGSMFSSCYSLMSLDVSNWSTANVTNMSSMFSYCVSLASLDVSDWSTTNVTNMNNMFAYCRSLTFLDVSDWSTTNVTNMSSMFSNCYSLTFLDVSNWSTANVTNMGSMFHYCYSLTSLDVSNFNFTEITTASNIGNMFRSCYGLYKSITIPATCAYIGAYCFADCRSLTEWHFLSTTPPSLSNVNAFSYMTEFNGKKIYVPAASVQAYKTATNWSTYADYIVGE